MAFFTITLTLLHFIYVITAVGAEDKLPQLEAGLNTALIGAEEKYINNPRTGRGRRQQNKEKKVPMSDVDIGPIINIPDARPDPSKRLFVSPYIENYVDQVSQTIFDRSLRQLFKNCVMNTLDTTVVKATGNDSFVITGDIDAMWLRDSTNQVMPYIRFAKYETKLREFLEGLTLRQLRSVVIDGYANAFNEEPNGNGHQSDYRVPPMQKSIFEGKYELDSLCSVINLCHSLMKATDGNVSFYAEDNRITLWVEAMEIILTVMEQQRKSTAQQAGNYPYKFKRDRDVYPNKPAAYTGMIRTAFRPSDDLTNFDFFTPANVLALESLKQLQELIKVMQGAFPRYRNDLHILSDRAAVIYLSVSNGLLKSRPPSRYNCSLAFETDGFNNFTMMDDAGLPNLLGIPFYAPTGVKRNVLPPYHDVRGWILSKQNPWYFEGTAAKGIGSPHTGPNMIWPMGLIVQALTSDDMDEVGEMITMLIVSANNTGFMHESFNKDNITDFTRSWFAWANSLFGELLIRLYHSNPSFLKSYRPKKIKS